MYHMAMPPHYGAAAHTPIVHPSIFPTPLLSPANHNPATIHQYPCQSVIEKSAVPVLHTSNPTSGLNPYQQQPAAYVNPYLQHHSTNLHANHIHHVPHMPLHSQFQGFPVQNSGGNLAVMSATNHRPHDYSVSHDQRQPLSVDEELMEDITTSHLGYLETEDSPQKMEQREKLENLIMEYLSITPHTHKFMFPEVLNVLEQSINMRSNFSAHDAACAFDALAHYAANLISQPWRKEFREIKLFNGFWVHQVSSHLIGAELILELIGYTCVDSSKRKQISPEYPSSRIQPNHYILEGVLDPDLISRLALDCMIAYCELQCLNKIKEGVSDYQLSWSQILEFRQLYVGGINVTIRQLLFTLRQRVAPLAYSSTQTPGSPDPTSPPPIPQRQSSSSYMSSKTTTPTGQLLVQPSVDEPRVTDGLNPEKFKIGNLTEETAIHSSHKHIIPTDIPAEAPAFNRCSDGYSSSRVPTARLIDLDSSHENLPHVHNKSSQHLLPKVLPHTSAVKSAHLNYSVSTEPEDPPPLESPKEAFQAGTLEEHLEATLNLVKNTSRNNPNIRNNSENRNNPDRNSLESWDFVFRGLEKKGYTKDIGDRGDILYDISRQKNNFPSETVNNASTSPRNLVSTSSPQNNVNLNNQSTKKDSVKNRPLTINQAMQQFTLNETKEQNENNASRNSSSIGHSYNHENHKRSSLYDNLSGGGFETAPQSSSEEYDTAADRRIPNPLRKINNNTRTENTNSTRSSDSLQNDFSGKKRDIFLPKSVRNSGSSAVATLKPAGSYGINSSSYNSKNATIGHAASHPSNSEDISDGRGRSRQSSSSKWPCVTCTFINSNERNVCDMCGKSRDPGPDAKPLVSGGKQCPLCTLINDRDMVICSACGANLKGSSTYI